MSKLKLYIKNKITEFFVFLLKEKPHYTREARVMRLVEHKQKQKSVPSSYYLILFLTSFSKKPIRERERERETCLVTVKIETQKTVTRHVSTDLTF